MLTTYRRHNSLKCRFTSRTEYRCKCPIWVTGTDKDGKFRREALKLRDWNRAQELVRKWDVEGDKPKRREWVAIEDWQKRFLAVAEADNLSPETVRKYKLLFRQLDDFAKEKGLRHADQFDLNLLDQFRGTWKDGPLSASNKIARLKNIFKFAVKRGFVERNVAEDMSTPEVKPNPTLPFTEKEMTAILKAASGKVKTFILVMRHSGLRISDVTTLAVSSLHGRRLSLYQAKTGMPVSILLPQSVVDELRALTPQSPSYFFGAGHRRFKQRFRCGASGWRRYSLTPRSRMGTATVSGTRLRCLFYQRGFFRERQPTIGAPSLLKSRNSTTHRG